MSCDTSDLLEYMANMSFDQGPEMDIILRKAEQYYVKTPISFWEMEELNILFGENSKAYYKKMAGEQKIKIHLKLE